MEAPCVRWRIFVPARMLSLRSSCTCRASFSSAFAAMSAGDVEEDAEDGSAHADGGIPHLERASRCRISPPGVYDATLPAVAHGLKLLRARVGLGRSRRRARARPGSRSP